MEDDLAGRPNSTLAHDLRGSRQMMAPGTAGGTLSAANAPERSAVAPEQISLPLSGDTRLFAVVGDPIGQVRSPLALTRRLAARGENAIVVPLHVVPRHLDVALAGLASIRNLGGVLVTVPHKAAALAHCAGVSERARFVGAVNVMRRGAGGWHGDNADGLGYAEGLAAHGFDIAGRSALLVGCGGAGSAVALELLERGAAQVALHDVDVDRRDDLARRLAARFPGRVRVGGRDPSGFDLVANVTPMGMRRDDPLPVDVDRLREEQFVACAITRPEASATIVEARRRGCRTMAGAGMFDGQAEFLADFLLSGQRTTQWGQSEAEESSPL
ncbi:MAG: hypothetical protein ROZ09_11240 [Thiobacillus sp.]|uniref:shikimate dehydrogenase family protein n=1 Tax=Thiobacillus sp. TaxID=924 RepID=UPI0028942C61|nr:hypothetical protein [Thiobacillus sp.]MDT3707393.1 hypothetical protein [Thiobacillus sp.]